MFLDSDVLKTGWQCKCPQCQEASLYEPGLSLTLKVSCENCGLDLAKNDSADGPAVFLIFILGFALVPLALFVDMVFGWPIWVHTIVWSVAALGLTVGSLRPLKAYIIALQYKHRRSDWN